MNDDVSVMLARDRKDRSGRFRRALNRIGISETCHELEFRHLSCRTYDSPVEVGEPKSLFLVEFKVPKSDGGEELERIRKENSGSKTFKDFKKDKIENKKPIAEPFGEHDDKYVIGSEKNNIIVNYLNEVGIVKMIRVNDTEEAEE